MTPYQRGDLILFSQRIFWQIVERWKEVEKDLANKGMIDSARSRWNFIINEKGEIVIFNECVTADVFNVFGQEFFVRFDKDFKDNWARVMRLPFESNWEEYIPSSNGRTNFKHFGWKMRNTIFAARKDDEDDGYADEPKNKLVDFRKRMD